MAQRTNSRLQEFRHILVMMRRLVGEDLRHLRQDIQQFGQLRHDASDAVDEAQDMESIETLTALIEQNNVRLRGITHAIERVDHGTYGVCIDCTGAIADKRLIANPLATRCRDCQESVESVHQQARPSVYR